MFSRKNITVTLLIIVILGAVYLTMNWHKPPLLKPLPDKLLITLEEDTMDQLPALKKIITDRVTVERIYNEIYALPTPQRGTYNCPIQYYGKYTLDFYKKDSLILHSVFNPTGCHFISLGNGESKMSFGLKGKHLKRISKKFLTYQTKPSTEDNFRHQYKTLSSK